LPHSQNFGFNWKLDRNYTPTVKNWDAIDCFLDTVTGGAEDIKKVLIAACAAVLQGRSDLHKALYLFGSGRNGKGAFLRLLELLVGDENCHSSSLESICENRFELANFYNKRLVVCPDEDRQIRGFSNFKKATGGDYLRGEEKNMKAFRFQFQGLIVLASNKPVFVGDSSYGLAQRLIPIPFSTTIPEGKQRNLEPEFKADLPAFTTYLLNLDRDWVTQTLKQAKQIETVKKLEWELTIRTDSVAAFYDDKLIVDPGVEVLSANLFEAYRDYCGKKGFSPQHENNFCPSLVELCKDKLQQDVSSYKTRKGKVIKGVRFRVDSDWDEARDGVTAVTTQNANIETSIEIPCDGVTAVTTQNANIETSIEIPCDDVTTPSEKQFTLEFAPKPPSSDRPIPKIIKVDEYVTYQLSGGRVQWIEIAFHNYATAKDWGEQIFLWGGKVEKPHKITRNGKKWLLRAKELAMPQLHHILNADLMSSPKQPRRR
jgi:P4 family phage/plasmid primase-like protien